MTGARYATGRGRWRVVVAFVLAACGPRSGTTPGPVAPQPSGPGQVAPKDPAEPHEGETAPELAERLRRLRAKQGEYLPASSSDPDACEYVCSLATSICGVKEKLCRLADERPGDDTYQHYCREAKLACKNAQDNCVACVEALEGRTGAGSAGR